MKKRTAVGAIILSDSKYLLIQKTSEHDVKSADFHPYIDFVKGGVKEGESLIDAVKREINEEINLTEDMYDIVAQIDEPLYFKFKNSSIYSEQITWFYIIKLHDMCDKFKANPDEIGEILLMDYSSMLDSIEFSETREFIKQISEKYSLK